MEKAWQLLSGKKYSVSQVAEEVGYTNLSAFSKAFKKYYNITARERSKENADWVDGLTRFSYVRQAD